MTHSDYAEVLRNLHFDANAPLNAIALVTDLLAQTTTGVDQQYIEMIRRAIGELQLIFDRSMHTVDEMRWERAPLSVSTPISGNGADRATSGISVLIVEDNRVNQALMSELLRRQGFNIVAVPSAEDALQTLDQTTIDVVLMDLNLPGMDGFEAARRIRSDQRFRKLPVVATTATSNPRDRDMCLRSGMNAFVTKPVSADRLIALIRELTEK